MRDLPEIGGEGTSEQRTSRPRTRGRGRVSEEGRRGIPGPGRGQGKGTRGGESTTRKRVSIGNEGGARPALKAGAGQILLRAGTGLENIVHKCFFL